MIKVSVWYRRGAFPTQHLEFLSLDNALRAAELFSRQRELHISVSCVNYKGGQPNCFPRWKTYFKKHHALITSLRLTGYCTVGGQPGQLQQQHLLGVGRRPRHGEKPQQPPVALDRETETPNLAGRLPPPR